MNTVVLVFDRTDVGLRHIADAFGEAAFVAGKVATVQPPGGRMYVCAMSPIEEGTFDEWPQERIPASPTAFVVDYRETEAVVDLVKGLAPHYEFWIDSNVGRVYSRDEFLNVAADPARRWWGFDGESST
ncbi:hypothetical protein Aca07nite_00750 [Actinoplanes capillaceus]|uniref:Uncharacterized protein n=1 Tax=Actinoplanes campanulatus TaxID=113559 RepID=A0ABQ3WB14_9ACTN|nr:hypothetical protein [Actinoplanes capillaceus]GID42800.1 hypothetical protein Aca07nite_00750 [Actinoplanes capillaceus]